jgi:hypothetical protein
LSESVTTLAFWANWFQIIGAVAAATLALWAILIARGQLVDTRRSVDDARRSADDARRSADDARRAVFGQFILGIDEAFRAYEDVRRHINQPSGFPAPDLSDMYRYIAVFERLGFFIDEKLLTIDKVNELYGDRFKNLILYGDKRYGANFPPRARPYAWDGFIVLWHALKEYRKVSEPPERSSQKKDEDADPELPPGSAFNLSEDSPEAGLRPCT